MGEVVLKFGVGGGVVMWRDGEDGDRNTHSACWGKEDPLKLSLINNSFHTSFLTFNLFGAGANNFPTWVIHQ